MKNKVINILTSYSSPKKVCFSGNEVIARSAIEWGVDGVFSYPGTPSTEISEVFSFVNKFQSNSTNQAEYPELTEQVIYFEYSINEKIALEKAIAYSIGNKSALCVMKNVGMNVAADALMSITYQTIVAPLVIVLCDDPGCHSSSNEQDSRYWGQMASVPVFNPATPAEVYRMTKAAFALSETLKLPVILRMTTRVSHTRGSLYYNAISRNNRTAYFDRLPDHINIPARTAIAHQRLLDKLQSDLLLPFFDTNNQVHFPKGAKLGIITTGVPTAYANEILNNNDLQNEIAVLDLGLIHPFPEKNVLDFLSSGLDKILILEELDPLVENAVRVIAQKHEISCKIDGKGFAGIAVTGEFTLDIVSNAIALFSEKTLVAKEKIPKQEQFLALLPPRPPTLCAGCPHRATFYALKLAIPRDYPELILCGDIGCFGLGALPPLRMIDTINHMGMSISMAQGLSEAFRNKEGGRKTVAMMGDGTFFHSGIASLLNAIHTRANILVIIFDNRTTGMTGGQDHPGANKHDQNTEIAIEPLVRGMGVAYVDIIDPFDLKNTFKKIDKAMQMEGLAVVVSRSPCVFLPDYSLITSKKSSIFVDPNSCNTCQNHADLEISCSKKQSPKSSLVRAKAKLLADVSIDAQEQLCPANICNHGFFNSILEGDYKTALNMVRDKMLFARSCGDICHRPCELFSNNNQVIPIKQLKKFVSQNDTNFYDFSDAQKQIQEVAKKNKKVAIIGAGPAGLSAAYDLIRNGYAVTIFEREQQAGGLVKFAIPNFRMDKFGFDYEANILAELGVEFKFGFVLGFNMMLNDLAHHYDAVLLAIGMSKAKKLDVINQTIPKHQQFGALAFLKAFNTNRLELKPNATILVIGGGNSAMDAARSAKYFDRTNRVILSCVETEGKLPAFEEEVLHAKEEGIEFVTDSYVQNCYRNGEKLLFDLNQFSSKENLQTIEADYIIVAIGQDSERVLFDTLEMDSSGRIAANDKTGQTNIKNIFVAGDLCANNHMSVIGAIASGKRAATGIRTHIEGYKYDYEGSKALDMLNSNKITKRVSMKVDVSETLLDKISHFDLFQSCQKCNHCIDNFACPALIKVNGKVQIDEPKCTHCGLCIDVCPNGAIQWTFSNEIEAI